VQPRGNLSFTAEGAQVSKRGEEGLLGSIARVLLASKHAKSKREDSPLPAPYNLAESLRVACQSTLYDMLVARSVSFLSGFRAIPPGLPNFACAASRPRASKG